MEASEEWFAFFTYDLNFFSSSKSARTIFLDVVTAEFIVWLSAQFPFFQLSTDVMNVCCNYSPCSTTRMNNYGDFFLSLHFCFLQRTFVVVCIKSVIKIENDIRMWYRILLHHRRTSFFAVLFLFCDHCEHSNWLICKFFISKRCAGTPIVKPIWTNFCCDFKHKSYIYCYQTNQQHKPFFFFSRMINVMMNVSCEREKNKQVISLFIFHIQTFTGIKSFSRKISVRCH